MIRRALLALALLLTAPLGAAAQWGCPWCTTPTTCSLVDEDSPLDECWYVQGVGCVPFYGECEFEPMQDEEDLAALAAAGLDGARTLSVETIVGVRTLYEVRSGTFVTWSCSGAATLIVRVDHRGLEWLGSDALREIMSLSAIRRRYTDWASKVAALESESNSPKEAG